MLKIKQGFEQKIIFVGSPNQIYGSHLEANRLHSMVESIKDLVYIELYDVLNEDSFDPKVKQPMQNLKLLATKTFEVRDLPFDKDCFVENYSVLLPIQKCKKVAEFIFQASFEKSVSPDFMDQPLQDTIGYMLTSKIFFTKEFAVNHDKELDKTNLICKVKNLFNPSTPEGKTRLYFNKEMLSLSQVFIRVKD